MVLTLPVRERLLTPENSEQLSAPDPSYRREDRRSEAAKAVARGVQTTRSGFVGAGGAAARLLQADSMADRLDETALDISERSAATNPARVQSIADVENLSDLGAYIDSVFFEQAPIMGAAIAGGLAGRAALGAKVGPAVGATGAGSAIESGLLHQDILNDPDAQGSPERQALTALVGGTAAGLIEARGATAGMRAAAPGRTTSRLRHASQQGLEQGLEEGRDEVLQGIITGTAHKTVNPEHEPIDLDLVNEGIAGALVGGALGFGGGLMSRRRRQATPPPEDEPGMGVEELEADEITMEGGVDPPGEFDDSTDLFTRPIANTMKLVRRYERDPGKETAGVQIERAKELEQLTYLSDEEIQSDPDVMRYLENRYENPIELIDAVREERLKRELMYEKMDELGWDVDQVIDALSERESSEELGIDYDDLPPATKSQDTEEFRGIEHERGRPYKGRESAQAKADELNADTSRTGWRYSVVPATEMLQTEGRSIEDATDQERQGFMLRRERIPSALRPTDEEWLSDSDLYGEVSLFETRHGLPDKKEDPKGHRQQRKKVKEQDAILREPASTKNDPSSPRYRREVLVNDESRKSKRALNFPNLTRAMASRMGLFKHAMEKHRTLTTDEIAEAAMAGMASLTERGVTVDGRIPDDTIVWTDTGGRDYYWGEIRTRGIERIKTRVELNQREQARLQGDIERLTEEYNRKPSSDLLFRLDRMKQKQASLPEEADRLLQTLSPENHKAITESFAELAKTRDQLNAASKDLRQAWTDLEATVGALREEGAPRAEIENAQRWFQAQRVAKEERREELVEKLRAASSKYYKARREFGNVVGEPGAADEILRNNFPSRAAIREQHLYEVDREAADRPEEVQGKEAEVDSDPPLNTAGGETTRADISGTVQEIYEQVDRLPESAPNYVDDLFQQWRNEPKPRRRPPPRPSYIAVWTNTSHALPYPVMLEAQSFWIRITGYKKVLDNKKSFAPLTPTEEQHAREIEELLAVHEVLLAWNQAFGLNLQILSTKEALKVADQLTANRIRAGLATAMPLGDGKIWISPDLSPQIKIEAAGHFVGRELQRRFWEDAPDNIKAKILEAHEEFVDESSVDTQVERDLNEVQAELRRVRAARKRAEELVTRRDALALAGRTEEVAALDAELDRMPTDQEYRDLRSELAAKAEEKRERQTQVKRVAKARKPFFAANAFEDERILTDLTPPQREALTQFEKWFGDQVARALTTTDVPGLPAMVAQGLRTMFRTAKESGYTADKGVEQFVETVRKKPAAKREAQVIPDAARKKYADLPVEEQARTSTQFEGQMTWAYKDNARPGLRSQTTFEAILAGERTSTMRKDHLDYWGNVQEGDIITWKGPRGERVQVRVTKVRQLPQKLNDQQAEYLSRKEGWSVPFVKKFVEGAERVIQIEYELVDQQAKPASPHTLVTKIISGGQTGADRAGLELGRKLNLATGGTAPKGFRTDAGPDPDLASYGVQEDASDGYVNRTKRNVDDSDGTVAFRTKPSPGTDKTVGYALTGRWEAPRGIRQGINARGHRPVLVLTDLELNRVNVQLIRRFLKQYGVKTLNVAGHREKSEPGIQKKVEALLNAALTAPEYEVSTKGDKRFSALNAKLSDGRTIEEVYQTDIKGYGSIKEGKGKPPKSEMTRAELKEAYLNLWREWALDNLDLIEELRQKAKGHVLVDRFAKPGGVSQADALTQVLHEHATGEVVVPPPRVEPNRTTLDAWAPALEDIPDPSQRKFSDVAPRIQQLLDSEETRHTANDAALRDLLEWARIASQEAKAKVLPLLHRAIAQDIADFKARKAAGLYDPNSLAPRDKIRQLLGHTHLHSGDIAERLFAGVQAIASGRVAQARKARPETVTDGARLPHADAVWTQDEPGKACSNYNLCGTTSKLTYERVREAGYEVSLINLAQRNPFGGTLTGDHKAVLTNVDGRWYIVDDPQKNLFAERPEGLDENQLNTGVVRKGRYEPFFIEVTPENLEKHYGDPNDTLVKALRDKQGGRYNNTTEPGYPATVDALVNQVVGYAQEKYGVDLNAQYTTQDIALYHKAKATNPERAAEYERTFPGIENEPVPADTSVDDNANRVEVGEAIRRRISNMSRAKALAFAARQRARAENMSGGLREAVLREAELAEEHAASQPDLDAMNGFDASEPADRGDPEIPVESLPPDPPQWAEDNKLVEYLNKLFGLEVRLVPSTDPVAIENDAQTQRTMGRPKFGWSKRSAQAIWISPRVSGPQRRITLFHEYGHQLFHNYLLKNEEGFAAVVEAWKRHVEKHVGADSAIHEVWGDQKLPEVLHNLIGDRDTLTLSTFTPEQLNYVLDFNEWFADQTARYLKKRIKEVPGTLVGRFFHGLGQLFRDYIQRVTKIDRDAVGEVQDFLYKVMDGQGNYDQPISDAVRLEYEKFLDEHLGAFGNRKDAAAAFGGYFNARDPLSHTARHAFRKALHEVLKPEERAVLGRAFNTNYVRQQILRWVPNAPLHDVTETIALGYQLWMQGKLSLGPKANTTFSQFRGTLREALGLVSDGENAKRVLDAMNEGAARVNTLATRPSLVKRLNGDATLAAYGSVLNTFWEKALPFFAVPFSGAAARMRQTKNPYLSQLAEMFYPLPGSNVGASEGYFEARSRRIGQFNTRFQNIVKGMDAATRTQVLSLLQTNRPIEGDDPVAQQARAIQRVFEDIYQYMRDHGVLVGKRRNYFPWVFDPQYAADHFDELAALLSQEKFAEAHEKIAKKWAFGNPRNQDILEELSEDGSATSIAILKSQLNDLSIEEIRKHGLVVPEPSEVGRLLAEGIINSEGLADSPYQGLDHYNPYFGSMNERTLGFIQQLGDAEDVEKLTAFMSKSLTDTLLTYTSQAVKRTEYETRFGSGGTNLSALLEEAKAYGMTPEQEAMAHRFVDAMLGKLGHKTNSLLQGLAGQRAPQGEVINPTLQKAMSTVIIVRNMAILALATFTSLVDPVGIAVRTGELGMAWRAYKAGMKDVMDLVRNEKSDARQLAETLGVIEQAMTQDMLREYYGTTYLNTRLQKANDWFFNMIGLNQWTRLTRVMAVAGAQEFLRKHKDGNATAHSKRFLQQLGLRAGDVRFDEDGSLVLLSADQVRDATPEEWARDERVKRALNRFVDEAILRPNAAQRAIFASDPHFMLLVHLKQFMWSFHTVYLRRAATEMDEGNFAPFAMLFLFVPAILAADFLRDIVQYGGDNPRKDGWGADDYAWDAVMRSGITGVAQPVLSTPEDAQYGRMGSSLLGPTFGEYHLLDDVLLDEDAGRARAIAKFAGPFQQLWLPPATP